MQPRKRQRPTRCWAADILWFPPFMSFAPVVPMNGFKLDARLLLTALLDALLRNLQSRGFCFPLLDTFSPLEGLKVFQ